MSRTWTWAAASVRGTSHEVSGTPCQDAFACRVISTARGDVFVVAVSDGAGSASYSDIGSHIACDAFIGAMEAFFSVENLPEDMESVVRECFQETIGALKTKAQADKYELRDLACTLLAAVMLPDVSLFLQQGDGAMVVSYADAPAEYCHIFWPGKGLYANTTYFITDKDAVEKVEIARVPEPIASLAVFTDGIESLALNFSTQSAHTPFFKGMFSSLQNQTEGEQSDLSASLSSFLDSDRVNERTDDDKTLVLALSNC